MSKTLVLAEKPSVGKELARVLGCRRKCEGYIEGDKYVVTWALGHLVTLADPEAYDEKYKHWNMADLPMLPQKMKLVVIKQSSKQYRIVSALTKRQDIADVVIATDAGREGELVARWILKKSGCKKPAKRLWISSQTDKAIKDGFNNLRPASEYDNLYKSAEARAHADWIVGLNVTRALTCKYNSQLSAGRVQTPTLALIVEREQQIKDFVPKDYFNVYAKANGFTALWKDSGGSSRIFDKQKAENLKQKVTGKVGIITSLTSQPKKTAPPAAYDLTELQRDANKKYSYSAKETLALAQSLYERFKVLTYPRTDSRYITDDIVSTLNERLGSICIGPYAPFVMALRKAGALKTKHLVNNAKVTDHHAIIPTEQYVDLSAMTGPERNIYDLVVRRFLAVMMDDFEYDETKITLTIDNENFYAKGKSITNPGWKSIYDSDISEQDDDDDEKEQKLPKLKKGEVIKILSVDIKNQKTKPPARYTEATLLTAMEHPESKVDDKELSKALVEASGLGTPATRADIIEKLFRTFYVERAGKSIMPTSKGIQLVDIVPNDLKSAELTAKWEQKLTQISKGEYKDTEFIEGMRKYASSLVGLVKSSNKTFTHDNVSTEKCPDCGKNLLNVKGKNGIMLVCPDRECGYRKTVSQATNARCPNCHKKMELRGEGDKRIFTCVCGFRQKLSDFEKSRQTKGASKRDVGRYLASQKDTPINNSLAEQLLKWKNWNLTI
jgi:DNA topoisomerase III